MDDIKSLLDLYRSHPCRTLPNAYWKTASALDEIRLDLNRDSTGDLNSLMMWQADRLMAYWHDPSIQPPLEEIDLSNISFALVHDDTRLIGEQSHLVPRQSYFRLIHRDQPPVLGCPAGFYYETVHPQIDLSEVVRVIQVCYADMNVSDKIVRSWQSHPVFDPDLWVWVVEKDHHRKAALGIAEFDANVPEASLEWIQVLPEYRRKGLGKAIVNELLRRVSNRSDFVTVSGMADNVSRPDLLYRSCGFTGLDLWWLLVANTSFK